MKKFSFMNLSPNILQYKSIEAFKELAKSPNAKIIISDGDLPVLMNSDFGVENVNPHQGSLRN